MNDMKPIASSGVATTNLLSSLTLREVTLRNRIVMSLMCQYCAKNGFASNWHLVHLGSRGGVGLVMVEATAVTRDGRITPGDMGLWCDEHAAPLARIARFVESQGAVPGIQLAHAGRKASCATPWQGGKRLGKNEGGWDIEQSIEFAKRLKALGIDLIDTSSGGLVPNAKIPVAKGFQVPSLAASAPRSAS